MQEDLAKKLELTNSVLKSKIESASKPPKSKKMKGLSQKQIERLAKKAEDELNGFYSDESEPSPNYKAPTPDAYTDKMKQYKEIQKRVTVQRSSESEPRQL